MRVAQRFIGRDRIALSPSTRVYVFNAKSNNGTCQLPGVRRAKVSSSLKRHASYERIHFRSLLVRPYRLRGGEELGTRVADDDNPKPRVTIRRRRTNSIVCTLPSPSPDPRPSTDRRRIRKTLIGGGGKPCPPDNSVG